MLHTKWNSIDKYSYSSHVTYTGAFSILAIPFKTGNRYDQRIRQTLLDFGFCCRIYPILELEEPSMLQRSKWSGEWLKPEYSEALSFHSYRIQNKFCQTIYPWGRFVSILQCLFQGMRNSGQHMSHDEVLKMELETGCCSWWMWRHSRTLITLGKNIRVGKRG